MRKTIKRHNLSLNESSKFRTTVCLTMTSSENPSTTKTNLTSPPKIPSEFKNNNSNPGFSGQKFRYPNPPDATNPDPATLREQWRYAVRQYSKWYSHAWGTAIFAGISFFALGWVIKGGNPIPSFHTAHTDDDDAATRPPP